MTNTLNDQHYHHKVNILKHGNPILNGKQAHDIFVLFIELLIPFENQHQRYFNFQLNPSLFDWFLYQSQSKETYDFIVFNVLEQYADFILIDWSIQPTILMDQSMSFQPSQINTLNPMPSLLPDHHIKNPLSTHQSNSFPLSKTLSTPTQLNTNTKLLINSNVPKLSNDSSESNISKPHLIEVFGNEQIFEESNFHKLIDEYYRSNQIVFVAVTGMKQSGKSLLCDTILNLCGAKGNYYYKAEKQGYYTWSNPFIKDQLRIFLVEINFHILDAHEQYVQAIQRLRKIVSTWIVMDHQTYIELDKLFQYHDSEQKQKIGEMSYCETPRQVYLLNFDEKDQYYKPSILPYPHLYRTPTAYTQPNEKQLLHELPSLSYNPQYLSHVQKIFTKIYDDCEQHRIHNKIPLTGELFLKIQKSLDNLQVGQYQKKLIQYVEDQYHKHYLSSFDKYTTQTEEQLDLTTPPKQASILFSNLREYSERAFIRYGEKDQTFMDMGARQKYYQCLSDQIQMREQQIIKCNQGKTNKELKRWFDQNKMSFQTPEELVAGLKKQRPELDHGRQKFVQEILGQQLNRNDGKDTVDNRAIENGSFQGQASYSLNKAIVNKEKELKQKEQQLQRLKSKNIQNSSQIHEQKQTEEQKQKLISKLEKLKQELAKIEASNGQQSQQIRQMQIHTNRQLDKMKQVEKQYEAKIENLRTIPKGRSKNRNFCGIRF